MYRLTKKQQSQGQRLFDERAYKITDRIFWIFIENTHPSYLNDFIEEDPNNPQGLRNTERGIELFDELEEFVRNTI